MEVISWEKKERRPYWWFSDANPGSYIELERRKKLNKKGFTLIEVLIGLILLAIGLLAIAGMQIVSVKGNFISHYLTQAGYVGQDRLEFLDHLPVDSAELQPGNHHDGTVTISGVVFNRLYTVAVNGDLRIITYLVSWNDGVHRSLSFSTIRSI
jgi:type IV pilus assembly protein PilV